MALTTLGPSTQSMTDVLSFITVDDLAVEIQKHHDSELLRSLPLPLTPTPYPRPLTPTPNLNPNLLRGLLGDLREKRVDLKEFCKRVRMLIGAPVLVATVKGLQVAQSMKKAQQWEQQLAANRAAASEQQLAPPFMAGAAEEPGNSTCAGAAAPPGPAPPGPSPPGPAPAGASTGGAPSASALPQPSGAAHPPSHAPCAWHDGGLWVMFFAHGAVVLAMYAAVAASSAAASFLSATKAESGSSSNDVSTGAARRLVNHALRSLRPSGAAVASLSSV